MNLLKMIFFVFVVFSIGCSDNPNENEVGSEKMLGSEEIIELSVNNNLHKEKFHSLFGNDFIIERMYKYVNDVDQNIYAEGESNLGSLVARYSVINGYAESCKAVSCSRCKLLQTGGCDCEKKETTDGYCEHFIMNGGEQ